jgi:REP element-mobilizing transposase RayT
MTVGAPAIKIGGVEDHVHILCRFGRTGSIADLVRDLKRDSAVWLKRTFPTLSEFDWQDGYGAFSISPAHVDVLIKYISNQEKHHQKVSFQDEYLAMLKKYNLEYDERYVWD